jgi:hypothetical protein
VLGEEKLRELSVRTSFFSILSLSKWR